MSFGQWLSIIGIATSFLTAIAALTTAILSFKNLGNNSKQLEEMAKQREELQKPNLLVGEVKDVIIPEPKGINHNRTLSLQLANVGNGVAKFVNVNTYFDLKYLMRACGDIKINEALKLGLKEESGRIRVDFTKDLKGEDGTFVRENTFYNDTIDQVKIPFIKTDDISEIDIPDYIVDYFDSICIVMQKKVFETPYFLMELCYSDSYNVRYTNKIKVKMKMTNTSTIGLGKEELKYSLEPEVIN